MRDFRLIRVLLAAASLSGCGRGVSPIEPFQPAAPEVPPAGAGSSGSESEDPSIPPPDASSESACEGLFNHSFLVGAVAGDRYLVRSVQHPDDCGWYGPANETALYVFDPDGTRQTAYRAYASQPVLLQQRYVVATRWNYPMRNSADGVHLAPLDVVDLLAPDTVQRFDLAAVLAQECQGCAPFAVLSGREKHAWLIARDGAAGLTWLADFRLDDNSIVRATLLPQVVTGAVADEDGTLYLTLRSEGISVIKAIETTLLERWSVPAEGEPVAVFQGVVAIGGRYRSTETGEVLFDAPVTRNVRITDHWIFEETPAGSTRTSHLTVRDRASGEVAIQTDALQLSAWAITSTESAIVATFEHRRELATSPFYVPMEFTFAELTPKGIGPMLHRFVAGVNEPLQAMQLLKDRAVLQMGNEWHNNPDPGTHFRTIPLSGFAPAEHGWLMRGGSNLSGQPQ